MRRVFLLIALGLSLPISILGVSQSVVADSVSAVHWQPWSSDLFARARREHKFVLLNLHTQWCHWCHVMETTTYVDPRVLKLLGEKYIAVMVDADQRPDLSNRYEDYGWPATVVYNGDGGEIVKRQGYLPPKEMASMLQAIIDDPTPGPSVTAAAAVQVGEGFLLSDAVRARLQQRLIDSYDDKLGSWGVRQKFLDWDNAEWCLRNAEAGDVRDQQMARESLTAQMQLLDPAWGGVYQYSIDGDWKHPHFEKIMQMQAENLRIYSLAFAQWHDGKDLFAAYRIAKYLHTFLRSSEGGFYTSQDADLVDGDYADAYFKLNDAQRRERGVPHVDQHRYARENGWAITSLAAFYEASGNQGALNDALDAAKWVIQNRCIAGGGFSHDEHDAGGPYLGDTLAMGQAFFELYNATGDPQFLRRTQQAADFICAHFLSDGKSGVKTADATGILPTQPGAELDENIAVARWANLVWQSSGRPADQNLSQVAGRYIMTPGIALSRRVSVGGILLADAELAKPAIHIAVVVKPDVGNTLEVYQAALAAPTAYKRIEIVDANHPAAGGIQYPRQSKTAAFLCSATSCSSPAVTKADLEKKIARALGAGKMTATLPSN